MCDLTSDALRECATSQRMPCEGTPALSAARPNFEFAMLAVL